MRTDTATIATLWVSIGFAVLLLWTAAFMHCKPRITYVTYDPAAVEAMPVDAVYTWVNPASAEWQDAYRASVPNAPLLSKKRFNNNVTGLADAELRTSVELLLRHCPWVRTVYIATMRPQVPPFLEAAAGGAGAAALYGDRVKVVHHDEFFTDPSVLPVFNSHAIEAHLHRIPNLSAQWLYLNDDFMTGRPVDKNMLFYRGKPVVRGLWMPTQAKIPIDDHVACCMNSGRLLNYLWYFHNDHTTTGVDSVAVHATATAPWAQKEWNRTGAARLRGDDQVVPLGLVENAALDNGLYVRYTNNPVKTYAMLHRLYRLNRLLGRAQQKAILHRYHFFCINNIPPPDLRNTINTIRVAFDLEPLA